MSAERAGTLAIKRFSEIFEHEEEARPPQINPNTDGVIVLSGHALYDKDRVPITWVSPENIVRIGFSIDVIKLILAKKLNKNIATNADIEEGNLFLYLNCEASNEESKILRNQIDDMTRIALAYNFPPNRIRIQDCVVGGTANTMTQFEVINTDPRLEKARHITLITSDYHAARVELTADKQLREGLKFDVLPAPQFSYDKYDVYERITGELERIVKYSAKGDISEVRTR